MPTLPPGAGIVQAFRGIGDRNVKALRNAFGQRNRKSAVRRRITGAGHVRAMLAAPAGRDGLRADADLERYALLGPAEIDGPAVHDAVLYRVDEAIEQVNRRTPLALREFQIGVDRREIEAVDYLVDFREERAIEAENRRSIDMRIIKLIYFRLNDLNQFKCI